MNAKQFNFQNLIPVDNMDLDIYEESLEYAFTHPEINNIAVSGAYGAGKSSLVNTYKKIHGDRKFLHISLAHFQATDEENFDLVKESVLEAKILNQLVHQIPSENISRTNFKIKRKTSLWNTIGITCLIMTFLICILHIIYDKEWEKFISAFDNDSELYHIFSLTVKSDLRLAEIIVLFMISCVFIFKIMNMQMNKNIFRKLSVQGAEIEIFEESNDSYFDKYLNEVLYLFENAEADAIVFEDLDRFNAIQIFERLREVNTLANIQLKRDGKKPLKFFYLLRDDIFTSKDRTKFFDYIIPVVPVVNSSNSYDQLITLFQENGSLEQFDRKFLQGLSLYVDDMRLLKNIYNEFIIYYNRINITNLDNNKMLAAITYKNIFPRDFSDLQLNRGFVFTLFENKEKYLRESLEEIHSMIEKVENDISYIKKECLESVQELDDVYNAKVSRASKSEWSARKKNQEEVNEWYETEYPKRKEAIIRKNDNSLDKLEKELAKLKKDYVLYQSRQLKDIITRENIDIIFSATSTSETGMIIEYNDVKENEYFSLLKYLIRNGYIDETYSDYMSYFYEKNFSRIDKVFLRSVTDKKALSYAYGLKNPAMVIDNLTLPDFYQEEILNFDLFALLLAKSKYWKQRDCVITQLRDTENYDFVGEFFRTGRKMKYLVENINKKWPEMLSEIIKSQIWNQQSIWRYSIYSLYYSDDEILIDMNKDCILTDYISEKRDYLRIEEPKITKLIHGFKALNVKFSNISRKDSNRQLFEQVYEESLYHINSGNLIMMLKFIYPISSEASIKHKNYSMILKDNVSPLAEYVEREMESYMETVFELCEERIEDDEEIVLQVLNHHSLSFELKSRYVNYLVTNIRSLEAIEDTSLWAILIERNIPDYSVKNIIAYFKEAKELDAPIIHFINRNSSLLDFSEIRNTCEKNVVEDFIRMVIQNQELQNDKYKQILRTLRYTCDNFQFEDIPLDKLGILIELSIIDMNAGNLTFIRRHYNDSVLQFIYQNIDAYIDIMTMELFSRDEMIEILMWDIDDKKKILLLGFSKEAFSVVGQRYSNKVTEYILLHNFEKDDFRNLLMTYDHWEQLIQQAVIKLACEQFSTTCLWAKEMSKSLLEILLASENLEQKKKVELFINVLPDLDEKSVKKYLNVLEFKEYLKIFELYSRPKVYVDQINEKLLQEMKKAHWIEDFRKDSRRQDYYRISKAKRYKRTKL